MREHKRDLIGMIRLIKLWVSKHPWTSPSVIPPAYCLELLVLYVHHVLGIKPFQANEFLAAFWRLVMEPSTLRVVFKVRPPHTDLEPQRPLIVDPVNPANNVARAFEWFEFQACAKKIWSDDLQTFFKELLE